MKGNELRIAVLIDAYLRGSITREELSELTAWTESTLENQQLFAELMDEKRLQAIRDGQRSFDSMASLEIAKVKYMQRRWLDWQRLAVAASILIACSIGGYFLLHQKEQAQIAIAQREIAPGHNQATLTLANGKKIIITKGLRGQLATQGTTIIQATNHDIAYNSTNNKDQVSYNTLATAQGEQSPYPLVLADGTKVWLNAESSITFPTAFNGKERIVKLIGEAYFEVKHNEKQPFKVQTETQTIEDIGTSFDVNAYANEPILKTTLVEGSIKVNNELLKPNEQARNASGSVTKTTVNTQVYTAWKDGYFRYDLETLPGIMREFARWYKVEVVFNKPATDQQFNMKVSRKATLNRALKILADGGVSYRLEGNKLIIN
ncbi:FecR family protein [Mucilaginibacter sp. AW1-3]